MLNKKKSKSKAVDVKIAVIIIIVLPSAIFASKVGGSSNSRSIRSRLVVVTE